ncbi:hypothetical protein E8E13_008349 [Curvularia kusanoi]|uniref:Metallo-beta-lactamase domain-containing protein n=1 Tax=Curvularia kusanoi TaxID=90978 RepID=A0A9P4WE41_CURKU|nr:hypothetical protein E8E13_008349 [Curvularia kusanoi]
MAQDPSPSPAATVTVHALSCGHFTLPEHQFVKPSSLEARRTVPSLAFLIQHQNPLTNKHTTILFDLGLRGNLADYPRPIQKHTENRQPIEPRPDVVDNLAKGGLHPQDIDYIIFSHVHWDHIGSPRSFPTSTFIVGHGSLDLLSGKSARPLGGHSFFEPDLLPLSRTIELSNPKNAPSQKADHNSPPGNADFTTPWHPHRHLPLTLDLFNDGALRLVHAPGHLPGHINVLARTPDGKEMYLAGDAPCGV